METRSLLLAAQFLLSCSLIAQSWCAPGATWVFEYNGAFGIYRAEHQYVADTLIDGVTAQKILEKNYGEVLGSPVNDSTFEYTSIENDVVLIHSTYTDQPTWDTLYWYGAIPGDRWWPPYSTMQFPPYGMLEVIDTGSVIIQGVQLRTLDMAYIVEEGVGSTTFTITERIGSNPRLPHVIDGPVIEYFQSYFICYSDTDIATGSQPCELTVSLPELNDPSPISIQPNPGSHFFQLTGLGDRPAQLRMLDLQGRVVLVSQNVTDQRSIDVSEFRSGIYMIEINNGFAGKQMLRWVKE